MAAFPEVSVVYDFLAQQLVLGLIWKVLLITLIATNIKLLPGVWHVSVPSDPRWTSPD